VVHPFHPLRGQAFELIVVLNHWSGDRVTYLGPEQRTRTLPVVWTDLAAVDPFVAVAAGRAPFRLADLLALRALVCPASPPDDAGGSAC
jgi:hypothetical protein